VESKIKIGPYQVSRLLYFQATAFGPFYGSKFIRTLQLYIKQASEATLYETQLSQKSASGNIEGLNLPVLFAYFVC
jgi:hypothetical protein